MKRHVEIPLSPPHEDAACGELLRQTLLDHKGVVSVVWDPARQVLSLEYLPERISLAQVEEVAAALGAATIGYWQEGAILMFLFTHSNTLESFDMAVRNDLDRFHLVESVIDRVPKLGYMAAYAKQAVRDKLIEHKQYIEKYGQDMPEIREWTWKRSDA